MIDLSWFVGGCLAGAVINVVLFAETDRRVFFWGMLVCFAVLFATTCYVANR